jgi:ribosomal protein L23
MSLYDVIKKPIITESSMLAMDEKNIPLKLMGVPTNF